MRRGIAAITVATALLSTGCAVEGTAQVAIRVIPDVVGMLEQDALHVLSERGPWPYVLRSEISDTVMPNMVISVGPAPGTPWPLSMVIDVVLSSSPLQGP
ncbi:PASTA domain-containing protein [Mycolicibacterium sp. YH-1]|uniref:PASTA domain-containing protein n=1 Tax=Mycolicibacterium sp. YH-1 TaxID=2908837 RepID=UPI001F4C0AB9|nr:PASTA domain-containing protein [Mycolicibacterium sp. YH-1]UNB52914.1 PASTA domain-containing protein [Mycolicibacterium sp. YH-1]